MTELSDGWVDATFGDLFVRLQYGVTAKADPAALGVRFLRITDLERGSVDWQSVPGLLQNEDIERFLLLHGDFVFARSGSIEKAARIEHPPAAVFASYLIRGTPLLSETSDWLACFIRSNAYLDQIRERAAGIGMANVNASKLASVSLPIPPLPEQRRIASKIDSLSAKSQRARDCFDHLPRLVEKYKQAILAAAFRGDLTREWREDVGRADPWEATSIGRILTDIRYGTARKCGYEAGPIPVLRIPNVQLGRISLKDIKSADFDDKEVEKLRLEIGDVLVIRSNGSLELVGRSAVVEEPAVGMLFAGYLIRLRLDRELADPKFFQLYLQAAATRAEIEQLAKSTSGVNNINSTQIQQLRLSRPDVDEQVEVARRVETAFAWIDRLASETTNARSLIDRLDQAVLAKAFRGELVPQDPADEPATVLLERIRAERPTAQRQSGRRGRPRKTA